MAERNGFEYVRLKEIATVEMGQSPDSRYVFDDPNVGIPFLQGNAEFGQTAPSPLFGCTRPKKQSEPQDVLVSVRAPVGAVNIADKGYCIGRGLAAIRPNNLPSTVFAKLVTYQQSSLRRIAQGTTFEAINKNDLEDLMIPSLPPREAKSIKTVLDTLDTAIQKTEAIIEKLQQVKQGLLHDLLTRGIDENGELRPPQSEAPHLYKESPLGWIPKRWDARALSSYVSSDITYGIVQAGPHVNGGVPYIKTGDMSGERLVREQLLCTSRKIADSYKRSELRTGDIVMAIRATVGKVLVTPKELDGANLTQGTARIAPNSMTDGEFLLWALRTERVRNAIQDEIKGTTFMEITLESLRKIPVSAPSSILEQKEISKRLKLMGDTLDGEKNCKEKYELLRHGVMNDLLSGRVRVTPLLKQ